MKYLNQPFSSGGSNELENSVTHRFNSRFCIRRLLYYTEPEYGRPDKDRKEDDCLYKHYRVSKQ